MIVLADIFRIDSPAARHAKVEHHRPVAVGMDQAIFCAPRKAGYPRTRQRLGQVHRERTPQIGAVDRNARDNLPIKHGCKSTDSGFYFW
jgi:hypothetical protein